MRKSKIIIADEDIEYILPLQLKFIEEMFDRIDLEIITEKDYFKIFLSVPQNADVLIISEKLYVPELQKHNIQNIFILTESLDDGANEGSNITTVYKYTSIKEILTAIYAKATNVAQMDTDITTESKIIVVTSGAGGAGKTTVSMGIAACLSKKCKRVLYLNGDALQSFQRLLLNKSPIIDNDLYMKLSQGERNIYQSVKHLIRNEYFDYLPPFKSALISLGLDRSIITEIVIQAKKSGDYDYIIVDSDNYFDIEKIKLIDMADRIVVLMTQNDVSVDAANQMIANIDIDDKERLIFVCNQYDNTQRNALFFQAETLLFNVNEYIEKFDDYWAMKDDKFMMSLSIQNLAISIL